MKKNKKISVSKKLVRSAIIVTLTLATGQQVYAVSYDPNEDYKDLGLRFWEDQKPGVDFYINSTSKYLLNEVPAPFFDQGDWSVFSLARGMYLGADYLNQIPANYFPNYIKEIEKEVFTNKRFGNPKLTDVDRLIFSLTPLNYNIQNVSSNNTDFTLKLSESFPRVKKQGINSPAWTLLAINSGNYQLHPVPEGNQNWNTEAKMIDFILDSEKEKGIVDGGGWALLDANPVDVDVTAMVIQSLAPYYLSEAKFNQTGINESHNISHQELKKAVERGIAKLSSMQMPHGGFGSYGTANSESTVQVIVALTELGINPKAINVPLKTLDKQVSFVTGGATRDGVKTNNMVDSLLTYWDSTSSKNNDNAAGFKHVTEGNDGGSGSGVNVNGMASDQATYGLIAYDRFMTKKSPLQNLNDQKDTPYKSFKAKPVRLTYNINGQSKVKDTSYLATAKLDSDTNIPKGKEFKHWNSKQDGSGTAYQPGEVLSIPKENVTLYAQYSTTNYELILNPDGGNLTTSVPTSFTVDNTIVLPDGKNMTKEGFSFAGWYKTTDFKGDSVTEISKGTAENITLYAKWLETGYLNVEESINKIGEVTLEKETNIKEARAAYDALDKEQQKQVRNLNVLMDAEATLEKLIASATEEEKIAAFVKAVENSINEIGEVSLESKEGIAKARERYESLGTNQNLVDPSILKKLTDAEEMLSNLQVKEVEEKISDLTKNEIILDSKFEIEYTRNLYNKLSDTQKSLVSNVKALEEAEEILGKLEEADAKEKEEALIKSVEEAIDAIGIVKLNTTSEEKISFARESFNKLDKSQQILVKNEKTLLKADEDYKGLVKARNERVKSVEAKINSIGKVTFASEKAIKEARKLHEALEDSEKLLVTNTQVLIKAEADFEIAKQVNHVETLIDAIGDIASENTVKISQADKAYKELGIHKKNVSATHREKLETSQNTLTLVDEIQKMTYKTITSDSKKEVDTLNQKAERFEKHLSLQEKDQLKEINAKLAESIKHDDQQLEKAAKLINVLVLGDTSKSKEVVEGAMNVKATVLARIEFDRITSSYGKNQPNYNQLKLKLEAAEKSVDAIKAVIAKIETLPNITDLTSNATGLIKEIEEMFNNLSPVEQNEVSNRDKLLEAQNKLNTKTVPTAVSGQSGARGGGRSPSRPTSTRSNTKRTLPKTGEEGQSYLASLGFVIMGSLYFWKKKK